MTSIAAQLKAIQAKSMMKAEAVYRETMFEISNHIIFRSPVDTGMFRANWLAGYEYDTSTSQTTNVNGATGRLTSKVEGLTIDRQFYFMNSLPYADRLEDGWSQQAATGMVKISIAEFNSIAQEKINKYKS